MRTLLIKRSARLFWLEGNVSVPFAVQQTRRQVSLWNSTFSMSYWAFRRRLNQIANSTIQGQFDYVFQWQDFDFLRLAEELNDDVWVIPIDDDDWVHPSLGDSLRELEKQEKLEDKIAILWDSSEIGVNGNVASHNGTGLWDDAFLPSNCFALKMPFDAFCMKHGRKYHRQYMLDNLDRVVYIPKKMSVKLTTFSSWSKFRHIKSREELIQARKIPSISFGDDKNSIPDIPIYRKAWEEYLRLIESLQVK